MRRGRDWRHWPSSDRAPSQGRGPRAVGCCGRRGDDGTGRGRPELAASGVDRIARRPGDARYGTALEGSTRLETLSDSTSQLKAARDEVDQAVSTQPPLAQLESWRANRAQLEKLAADRAALDLDALGADLAEATSARDRGVTDLNTLRMAHAAHVVREGLVPGEPCPVCLIVVGEVPEEGGGPSGVDGPSDEGAGWSRVPGRRGTRPAQRGRGRGQGLGSSGGGGRGASREAPGAGPGRVGDRGAGGARRAQGAESTRTWSACTWRPRRPGQAGRALHRASAWSRLCSAPGTCLRRRSRRSPGDDPVQAWQLFESWRVGEIERRQVGSREAGRGGRDWRRPKPIRRLRRCGPGWRAWASK